MRIGFFDSGVGGLTVLHESLKQLPGHEYFYYADSAHVPYGNKSKHRVRSYILDAAQFLIAQQIDALVIACNTATSIAINELRKLYTIPIIGMEPAVKPAVNLTKDRRVLVLATEMTLKEEKFQNLLSQVDNNKVVDYLSVQKLVTFAEKFELDGSEVHQYLESAFMGIDKRLYSIVVLGCTHFIYFQNIIKHYFADTTLLIDGNQGTVRQLQNKISSLPDYYQSSTKIHYFQSGILNTTGFFTPFMEFLASV